MKNWSPLLAFLVVLCLVCCQKTNLVSKESYKKSILQTEIPDGKYYYHNQGYDQSDQPSNIQLLFFSYNYPVGMDVQFIGNTDAFKIRYFVDVGSLVYLDEDNYSLPDRVDSLMFKSQLLDPKRFIGKGLVAQSMLNDTEYQTNSGFTFGAPEGQPFIFHPLQSLRAEIDVALSPDQTTNAREASFRGLRYSNHYVKGVLVVKDVVGERLIAEPSNLGRFAVEYAVSPHFANSIRKAQRLSYWALADLSRVEQGALKLSIFYLSQ
jgi:hypothetical protein